ncbi:hypothetical protein SASC598O02_014580 [Snodgrassella alvi SCGC AB-598-O02]|nr:hypothetical protein SASC598O02_014580 [Snodgrassella alvi SCGC AB-598-O02]
MQKEQNRHYGFHKAKFQIKIKVNLTKKDLMYIEFNFN